MIYRKSDFAQVYAIGPSNGTHSVSEFLVGHDSRLIAIESMEMFSGQVVLDAAPSQARLPRQPARSAVHSSLERSLSENAEVWAELSKY